MSIWKPHVTVAAVIERDTEFLMVEETIDGKRVLNQPAGHLEPGESLVQAVIRETLEETGWHIRPNELVGIYRYPDMAKDLTYLRFCFTGQCKQHESDRELDTGIERTLWMGHAELIQQKQSLRSELVLRSIEDYLAGIRYPLTILKDL